MATNRLHPRRRTVISRQPKLALSASVLPEILTGEKAYALLLPLRFAFRRLSPVTVTERLFRPLEFG